MLDDDVGRELLRTFVLHVAHQIVVRQRDVERQFVRHIVYARVWLRARVDFAVEDAIRADVRDHVVCVARHGHCSCEKIRLNRRILWPIFTVHARDELMGHGTGHFHEGLFDMQHGTRVHVRGAAHAVLRGLVVGAEVKREAPIRRIQTSLLAFLV